ncbi:unnamed protein product [Brassica oleracea var. botrytis]
MAPESSRDETASNEKSRDGKGGEKSPANPSDTTAPILYTKVYNVVYTSVRYKL